MGNLAKDRAGSLLAGRSSGRSLLQGANLALWHLLRRFLSGLVAVWGAVTLVFFMLLATGSPVYILAGPQATQEDIDRLNALYGFDRPLYEQYARFIGSVLRGQFPDSLRFHSSPFDLLFPAIPLTFVLALTALVVGSVLGLLTGYVSATSRNRLLREIPLFVATVLQSTPVFVIGILFVLLFSLTLGWFPTSGSSSPLHLVLPAASLSLLIAPPVARLFRASILQQRDADHVRTALAKDIPLAQVQLRHVAANALVPVISLIGLQAGSLLGGAVLTETVFGWPGIGTVTINAVAAKDYPVILAAVFLIAIAVSLANFIADLLVAAIDPRTAVVK
ncbi:ABC transporter permease [Mesorhizobium sp. DCY119]|uniref:ABC transporter permease n=1 Tax=Mesorhizobium sp. DCY119 TaxID=2108445 RepID=UPI000E71750E|nr:ABC transporter permease [Mesorhizobium sp. DCY119]RJG40612.1 ABC transporter permease [Mesorhizobium sp. DCY119]